MNSPGEKNITRSKLALDAISQQEIRGKLVLPMRTPDTTPEFPASPTLRMSPDLKLFRKDLNIYREPRVPDTPRSSPSTAGSFAWPVQPQAMDVIEDSNIMEPPPTPRISERDNRTLPHPGLFPQKQNRGRMRVFTAAFRWLKKLFRGSEKQ